jgi:hypothetical protein
MFRLDNRAILAGISRRRHERNTPLMDWPRGADSLAPEVQRGVSVPVTPLDRYATQNQDARVGDEKCAGYVGRLIRGQKQNQVGNFLWITEAALRNCLTWPTTSPEDSSSRVVSRERDRRFAVTRCWSEGDLNCRSTFRSVYSGRLVTRRFQRAKITTQRSCLRRDSSARPCRK